MESLIFKTKYIHTYFLRKIEIEIEILIQSELPRKCETSKENISFYFFVAFNFLIHYLSYNCLLT